MLKLNNFELLKSKNKKARTSFYIVCMNILFLALMMLKFLKILLIGNRKLSGFFVVIGKNTITKAVLGLINIKVK